VEGSFLGGARSPRPHCKAVRTPRHFISTTCVDDEPVAKGRQRWRCAVVTGVRSPPLREMVKRCEESLTGANRGTAPKPLFSEGRTLRVRMARLNERQGIPFPPDACARGRDPNGEYPPRSQCRRCGRAEPAPPRGGRPKGARPRGERPGDNVEAAFLGGARSPRPHCKAELAPWHAIFTR